jgi:histidine transport system substrate-binding protein
MKTWTMALSLALAAAATASSVHAADLKGREIRLAVDPTYPPLEYKTPDGKLTEEGAECDNALFAHLNAHCVWL